ncbi:RHS repeat-associated core domain-containing protein, partial [Flavobacterium columnare]
LFNGKELDRETNLTYYGARYLDMKTSLWLNIDPLAEKFPSWSPYCFVMNNPLRLIDPTGMAPEDIIIIGN